MDLKRSVVAVGAAALLVGGAVVSTATPALADKGGQPNARSCGGIGREAQTLAAMPGPMNPAALFAAQGPFTCDDVGEEQG